MPPEVQNDPYKLLDLIDEADREGTYEEAERLKIELARMLESKRTPVSVPLPAQSSIPAGTATMGPAPTHLPRKDQLGISAQQAGRIREQSTGLFRKENERPNTTGIVPDEGLRELHRVPWEERGERSLLSQFEFRDRLKPEGLALPGEQEDVSPEIKGEEKAAALARAREVLAPSGEQEDESLGVVDLPTEGVIPPKAGVKTIPLSDGNTQDLKEAYPMAGAFANMVDGVKKATGEILTANANHGAVREDPIQRIVDNPDTNPQYWPEDIPAEKRTRDNILPKKIKRLTASTHSSAGGKVPTAIDIHPDDLSDEMKIEGGSVKNKQGKLVPSNKAFRASAIGKHLTDNMGYWALRYGFIPRGDDSDWYNKYGKKEGQKIPGIQDPNAPRLEHWHYEYDPKEAERRLIKLGYMDPQTKEILSDSSADTGIKEELLKDDPEAFNVADALNKEAIANQNFETARSTYRESRALHQAEIDKNVEAKAKADLELKELEIEQGKANLESQETMSKNIFALDKSLFEKTEKENQRIKILSDEIKESTPDPFRRFAWISDKGETTPGKAIYTIGAAIALVLNAALTIKTAKSKKGKMVPFMAFNMIMQAIDRDMRGQEAALTGKHQELNSRISLLGQYYRATDSKKLSLRNLQKDYIDEAKLQVGQRALTAESDQQKADLETLSFKLQAESDKVKMEQAEEDSKRVSGRLSKMQGVINEQELQAGKIALQDVRVRAAEVQIAKHKAAKDKLTPKQKDIISASLPFIMKLKRMRQLWGAAAGKGAGWAEKKLVSSGLIREGHPLIRRETALDYLLQYGTMVETSLAQAAKQQGNSGTITEAEQIRGGFMFAITDSPEAGAAKLDRLIARTRLSTMRAWHQMNEEMKGRYISRMLALPDTPEGIAKQAVYINGLIDDLTMTGERNEQDLALNFKVDKEGGPSPSTGQGSQVAEEEKPVNTEVPSGVPL